MTDPKHINKMLAALEQMNENLRGMRQSLVNDGWTKEQAQDIIAATFRQVGKENQ